MKHVLTALLMAGSLTACNAYNPTDRAVAGGLIGAGDWRGRWRRCNAKPRWRRRRGHHRWCWWCHYRCGDDAKPGLLQPSLMQRI
jgi:hypothetical protein